MVARTLLVLVGVLVLAGCTSAKKELRRPALILLDQMKEYDAQLGQRIELEGEYYKGVRASVTEAAAREVFLQSEQLRLLAISATADETLLAGSPGVRVSRLTAFLAEHDKAFDASLRTQMEKLAEARALEGLSVAALKRNQADMKAAQDDLLEVIREPSTKERFARLVEFAQKTAKEYKAKEKKDDAAPEPAPVPSP